MADFKYLKLRGRIKEKYGTEGRFAEAIGISQVSLSRKFNDKVQFSADDIKLWCRLLDIPVEQSGNYFFE